MSDPSAVAAYREALAVAGVPVTIQRVSGYAPNVTVVASATVTAAVRNIKPDGTQTAQAGLSAPAMGAIEQGDRMVILLSDDLAAAGFPVPVQRADQVVLPDSGEVLNVLLVDPYKRRIAGAVELTVTGVS
jgi:hypothetical protein